LSNKGMYILFLKLNVNCTSADISESKFTIEFSSSLLSNK